LSSFVEEDTTVTVNQSTEETPVVLRESVSPEAGIGELAESRLRCNPYLALKNVSCDYREGVLILRGCVTSYYLKQIAQAAVAPLDGVLRIENQIEVLSQSPGETGHVD
jgi:hypothetical protein